MTFRSLVGVAWLHAESNPRTTDGPKRLGKASTRDFRLYTPWTEWAVKLFGQVFMNLPAVSLFFRFIAAPLKFNIPVSDANLLRDMEKPMMDSALDKPIYQVEAD